MMERGYDAKYDKGQARECFNTHEVPYESYDLISLIKCGNRNNTGNRC